VLTQLREEGFSQAQSIKATVERLGVSLTEAKKIVHLGAAWADDSFHEALDEAASFVTRSGPQRCPISGKGRR
jgi:ribosomal protein L7/L12